MDEIFDNWNEVKKKTHKNQRKLGIKPREIFWLKIGQNIGSEEYGKDLEFVRPVIIVKQLTNDLFIGIPTTTAKKENNDYFHNIKYFDKNQNEITSSAMICQFRTFSKKRLLYKIGKINELEFKEILEKLKRIIDSTC
jgi:mRNA interferase MazF